MDPRTRLPSVSDSIINQIAVSLADHLKWLDDHLEDVRNDAEARRTARRNGGVSAGGSDFTSTLGNLLKSPVRKRAPTSTRDVPASPPPTTQHFEKKAVHIFGSPASSARPPSTLQNTRLTAIPSPQRKTVYNVLKDNHEDAISPPSPPPHLSGKRVPSNSSLLRSPAKVGLSRAASARSPGNKNGGSRGVDDGDKENSGRTSSAIPPAKITIPDRASSMPSSANNSSTRPATASTLSKHPSIRSPARTALSSSTSSRQPQSPSAARSTAPTVQQPAAPASRIASPTNKAPTSKAASAKEIGINTATPVRNSPPQRVLDDVFMVASQTEHSEASRSASGDLQEDEEEDDEEVADILLGYTKTPLQTTKKATVHSKSPVNDDTHTALDKSLPPLPGIPTKLTAFHTSPTELQTDMDLVSEQTPLPQDKNGQQLQQQGMNQSKASPPRPMRSPARPSPLPPKGQIPTTIPHQASAAASPINRYTAAVAAATSTSTRASPRPPPRNMSNLASIASVLGSPVKGPALKSKLSQNPEAILEENGRATPVAPRPVSPRPGSPNTAASTSKVPVASPSSRTTKSPAKSPISKIIKSFSPPTRSSPRLAASQNSPVAAPTSRIASPSVRSPKMQNLRATFEQAAEQHRPSQASRQQVLSKSPVLKSMTSPKQIGSIQSHLVGRSSIPTSPRARQTAQHSQPPPPCSDERDLRATTTTPAMASTETTSQTERVDTQEDPVTQDKVHPVSTAEGKNESQPVESGPSEAENFVRGITAEKEPAKQADNAIKPKGITSTEPAQSPPTQALATSAVQVAREPSLTRNPAKSTVLSKSTAPSLHAPLDQPGSGPSSHAAIPPSPIFSSMLSSNSVRSSAFSFAGLNQGNARSTLGGGREKSLGIGLGLGLGKSLGAGLGGQRIPAVESQQSESDSQGSTQSATAGATSVPSTSTLSSTNPTKVGDVTTFRKRLSSVMDGNVDSEIQQSSGSNKAARHEGVSSSRVSLSYNAVAAPLSKEEETKQRLVALRSRISTYQEASRHVGARFSTTANQGLASTTAARVSTRPSVSSSTAIPPIASKSETAPAANATMASLFSPPLPTPSTSNSLAHTQTSATSAFASAVASYVPAPISFASSFANFFSSSMTTLPPVAKRQEESIHKSASRAPESASPIRQTDRAEKEKAAHQALYPSLPSMTNLVGTSMLAQQSAARTRQDTHPDEMEILQSPKPRNEAAEGEPARQSPLARRSSASSVQDIVGAIEAKTAAARVEEQRREATLSPIVNRKRKSHSIVDSPSRSTVLPATKKPSLALQARSTTPPFSPPAVASVRDSFQLPIASTALPTKLSSHDSATTTKVDAQIPKALSHSDSIAAGELLIDDDLDGPEIEAIPRAPSVDTEYPDASDEEEDSASAPEGLQEADEDQEVSPARTREPAPSAVVDKAKEAENTSGLVPAQETSRPSSPAPKEVEENAQKSIIPPPAASTLKKSTSTSNFKPVRPNRPTNVISDSKISRPPSRAPSIASLAPSRTSTASIASSANFGLAKSTTVNAAKKTALGASTSGRAEVRSLQLAAAAAKKETAEKERKAQQKEERDQKRAAFAASRDAGSTAATSVEAEKKRKDRDELAQSQSKGKAPLHKAKVTGATKVSAEASKKRKVEPTVEVLVTKPPVKKTTVTRPAQVKTNQPAAASNHLSASTSTASGSGKDAHSKALSASANMIGVVKQTTAGATTKGPLQSSTKAPPQTTVRPAGTASTQQAALLAQHQQAILKASQSLANSQTHTLQPKQAQQAAPPRPPSEPEPEPFELPEVDSEYSDSDEEEQAKKAALRPGWTHSPELRQALAMQASFNPDELFGAIPQLHMEEMFKFKGVAARLRNRTSSANWSGVDALQRYEEEEYARRMGFRKPEPSTSSRN